MKQPYAEIDYQKDAGFIRACFLREKDDAMGKLEALMMSRGRQELYIGHEALPKFLSLRTAYRILENKAFLVHLLMNHNNIHDMPGSELKQWSDECLDLIAYRVENLFKQRHRGAVQRVLLYEKRLFAPYFMELRRAIRKRDADCIYDTIERIGIMSENFSSEHPVMKEYESIISDLELISKG
ncbi:MAG: hypothetical protein QW165_05555 [Candidatus Woesearchaeota archaeon]